MVRLLLSLCVCLALALPSDGAQPKPKEKPKTLAETLQGDWTRRNHEFSYSIIGNVIAEYSNRKPRAVHASGPIEFLPGEDYAKSKLTNGWVLLLLPPGENGMAIETYEPNGLIWEDGRLFFHPRNLPE